MSETKSKGGRPRVDATPVTVRVAPDLLAPLDAYATDQADAPGRPEAIRRLLKDGLERLGYLGSERTQHNDD